MNLWDLPLSTIFTIILDHFDLNPEWFTQMMFFFYHFLKDPFHPPLRYIGIPSQLGGFLLTGLCGCGDNLGSPKSLVWNHVFAHSTFFFGTISDGIYIFIHNITRLTRHGDNLGASILKNCQIFQVANHQQLLATIARTWQMHKVYRASSPLNRPSHLKMVNVGECGFRFLLLSSKLT